MFVVDEATAAAILALHQGGELSAVIELRRHFPLITDDAQARRCVRTICRVKALAFRGAHTPTPAEELNAHLAGA